MGGSFAMLLAGCSFSLAFPFGLLKKLVLCINNEGPRGFVRMRGSNLHSPLKWEELQKVAPSI